MRLWADAYNALGQRVEGPVQLQRARVTRLLDGAGNIEIDAPLLDERARRLLNNEVTIAIWNEIDVTQRRVGTGILNIVTKKVSSSEYSLNCTGPDSLDRLRRKNTLLRRKYNGTALEALESLAALAGWSVSTTAASWPAISMQFDGQSVLNALITVAQSADSHLRLSLSDNTIEVGSFGDSISVLATNQTINSAEIIRNTTVLLIDSLQVGERSDEVYTWLIPFGGGEGVNAVTLAEAYNAGNTEIFTISGPDGQPLYGISDEDGLLNYGQIEIVKTFSPVVALTNDAPGKLAASITLFNTAKSWLKRQATEVVTYKLTVRKVLTTVRPGDRIRVFYSGIARTPYGEQIFLEVDDLFYVTRATETLEDSISMDLEVSTVDRVLQSPEKTVVETIVAQRQDQTKRAAGS